MPGRGSTVSLITVACCLIRLTPAVAEDAAATIAPPTSEIAFSKHVLTDRYYCDGVAAGDIDGDGQVDLVAGPFWYRGPTFQEPQAFYEPVPLDPAASPSDSMFSFVHDFSGDGWNDILVLGRVHKHPAMWYQNPGQAVGELWEQHFAFERVRGESPTLVDLDGNGLPQLICHWQGRWGSIEPHADDPTLPWRFIPIGDDQGWAQFYHGEGVGDLNADGRLDLILNDGWYEQPAGQAQDAASDDVVQRENSWSFFHHPFSSTGGGAQMFVQDVDGDDDQDVITALDAHGWGLAWYEQRSTPSGRRFFEHLIMGDRSLEPVLGAAFTQPHALAHADIDGDGLLDIVTGKRRWAHGPSGDIEPAADPVVYWFQLVRGEDRGVQYRPHLIDDRSGVGVQILAEDLNGDGKVDVATASKLGTFVFLQETSTGAKR